MEPNLFDPLEDEELTVSGNNDPLDNIHSICQECGGVNDQHKLDCDQIFYTILGHLEDI